MYGTDRLIFVALFSFFSNKYIFNKYIFNKYIFNKYTFNKYIFQQIHFQEEVVVAPFRSKWTGWKRPLRVN